MSLHRLRKSLEPKVDKSFGFSYLHLRSNLVSLDSQLCQVDSDQFASLVRAGASEEQRGDIKKAVHWYIQAAEIYPGDYLAQDLYVDWIVRKRRELKNNYLQILMKLGRFFEMKGAVYKAISWYSKAMQADPLLEEACQRLMVLYAQKGKSNQAIQTYEQCRLALRDEIETEPEPLTRELYQSIVRNRSQPGNRS